MNLLSRSRERRDEAAPPQAVASCCGSVELVEDDGDQEQASA
jgi:hypothetical protein